MIHPLEQKLTTLRSRAWRLVALHAVCWVIAGVLGTLLVVGMTDYWVRFQDRGVRLVGSLAVLGILGWTCYRYVYFAWRAKLTDVDLALRLQRKFPALEDRLVSTVEFLRQPQSDPLAGSAELRRAVIARTTAESEGLDFCEVLDARRPVRAAMVGGCVVLIAAILVILDWQSSQIAVARIVNPFGDTQWLKRTHLVPNPTVTRVARGQTFRLEVIDSRGRKLPSDVRIHYQFSEADGSVRNESEAMRPVLEPVTTSGGKPVEAVEVIRPSVARPFAYRVEGGDDRSMDWIDVAVVEPPTVKSFVVDLDPPEYTNWPSRKTKGHVRLLAGTRIALSGEASTPLKSIDLCLVKSEMGQPYIEPQQAPDERFPGQLSRDGRQFTIRPDRPTQLLAQQPGTYWYWFELTDRRRLRSGPHVRWELRAETDLPPSVSIDQPHGNLHVTPRAIVPLKVTAEDDLAVHQTTLATAAAAEVGVQEAGSDALPQSPQRQVPQSWIIYEAPQPSQQPTGGLLARESHDRRMIEYRWDLATLGLSPGDHLDFHAVVSDDLKQTAKSDSRHLIVVSEDEYRDRIASRQIAFLAELEEVLEMQRAAGAQVASRQTRLREVVTLDRADVDHLRAAELGQRQVANRLTNREDGVPSRLLSLLEDMKNNRIDAPDIERRMRALLAELDRLGQQHLPAIARELTAAIKATRIALDGESAGQEASSRSAVTVALDVAATNQDHVIASLERIIDQLAEWDRYRRFHREVSQLLRSQKELAQQTRQVGTATATRPLRDLPPSQRADLKNLQRGQLELARQLDRVQAAMEQAIPPLQQNDPLAGETISDALQETRRLAISGRMRASGEHVAGNQIGQSLRSQTRIVEDLQAVLDILANRRQHEMTRLLKKLDEAETELAELSRRQADLRKRFQAAESDTDANRRTRELKRLARQQELLRDETERTARRLQRLSANRAAQATSEAAAQMNQATQAATQGNASDASGLSEEARQALELAREEVQQRRRQAQADLATEQLARLRDALEHLHQMQQRVIDETVRYEDLRKSQGQLFRAQTIGLGQLAQQQRTLQTETLQQADQLAASGPFHLALSGAGQDMGRAAALLQRLNTGADTQRAEQNALQRLALLLEALEEATSQDDPAAETPNGGGGEGHRGSPPGEALQRMAELRLLTLMQAEIQRRTAELQQAVSPGAVLTDSQRAEYAALSQEQGRLVELVLQWIPPQPDVPETVPERVPPSVPTETIEIPSSLPEEDIQ